jgi:cysteine-rich repeat protein
MFEPRRFIVVVAVLLVAASACAYSYDSDDTATDDSGREGSGGDADDAGVDEASIDAVEVDEAGTAEVDTGPRVCGNAVQESGEICDDGNLVTEACATTDPTACLADCSLRMAGCGNGSVDPGEACDDSNDSSMDACTTSCTVNDHGIGAPCQCTGTGCTPLNPAAGTIVGCDAIAALADATRAVACARSVEEATIGVRLYFPAGYCMLASLSCTGSLCSILPTVGDVDAFSCPAGSAVLTDTVTYTDTTITLKGCYHVCATEADCRWNEQEAADSPFPGCGQYTCIAHGDAGERVCLDRRQTG